MRFVTVSGTRINVDDISSYSEFNGATGVYSKVYFRYREQSLVIDVTPDELDKILEPFMDSAPAPPERRIK